MSDQLVAVLGKLSGGHVEAKVDPKEKVHFQTIHFRDQYPAHFGVVGIVIVRVVKELGRQ